MIFNPYRDDLTTTVLLAATACRGLRSNARGVGMIIATAPMLMVIRGILFVSIMMAMATMVLMIREFSCMAMFIQAGTNMLRLGSATRCTHCVVNIASKIEWVVI